MINKQSLWFVTLLSLVLVLGVYYVTMPNDLLKTEKTENVNSEVTIDVEENDMLVALRVERDEEVASKMDDLETILTSETSTTDEKNNAFEELKLLNLNIGKEEEIETLILDTYKIKSYVEINNDQIKVVVNSSEHDSKLANDIMRTIQSKFDEKMYITIKFETN
mgnify:CR=1 FL=1